MSKRNRPDRAELMHVTVQAYMELFISMQMSAFAHWLMFELTFAQARAVIILAARKELTVSQLASLLGVGNPAASVLVQQLVEKGLVTRTEQAADRRHTLLRLSAKGAEIGAGRRQQREQQWRGWLEHLSDQELSALAHGLSALTSVVQKEFELLSQQASPKPRPAGQER